MNKDSTIALTLISGLVAFGAGLIIGASIAQIADDAPTTFKPITLYVGDQQCRFLIDRESLELFPYLDPQGNHCTGSGKPVPYLWEEK